VQLVERLPSVSCRSNEAALALDRQVIRQPGLLGAHDGHQLGDRGWPAHEVVQHGQPQGVGEGLRDREEASAGIHHSTMSS
jgi:hypothetical protein